jgi:RNA-binding protein
LDLAIPKLFYTECKLNTQVYFGFGEAKVTLAPIKLKTGILFIMKLTAADKKQYRAIAHNLNPVIIVGDKGLSDGLLEELNRALEDHELIKVKIASNERDVRAQLTEELCEKSKATLVQTIGKIAILLRKNAKPNPKLSNLLRA